MIILLFSDGFESGFELYSNDQGGQQQSIENESNKSNMNRSLSTTSESSSSVSSLGSSASPSSKSKLNEKLNKIQQAYIEIACRYLHDEFGFSVGRRMFQSLLPLLFGKFSFYNLTFIFLNFLILDLQKLCSTLANVNLCELAEEDDHSSSSSSSTSATATMLTTNTIPSITPNTSDHQSSQIPSSQFNSMMISGTSHLNELQKENRGPSPPNTFSTSSNNRLPFANNSIASSSSSVLSNSIPTYGNYQV